VPASKDAFTGPDVLFALAEIYVTDRGVRCALDQLEHLLSIRPTSRFRSCAVDPLYAPLRGNPRFERLVRGPLAVVVRQRAKLTHSLWGRGRRPRYPFCTFASSNHCHIVNIRGIATACASTATSSVAWPPPSPNPRPRRHRRPSRQEA